MRTIGFRRNALRPKRCGTKPTRPGLLWSISTGIIIVHLAPNATHAVYDGNKRNEATSELAQWMMDRVTNNILLRRPNEPTFCPPTLATLMNDHYLRPPIIFSRTIFVRKNFSSFFWPKSLKLESLINLTYGPVPLLCFHSNVNDRSNVIRKKLGFCDMEQEGWLSPTERASAG